MKTKRRKLNKRTLLLLSTFVLIFFFWLIFALRVKSQELPTEVELELAERETLRCEPIPYGEFLTKTGDHLEKFLPLLGEITRATGQIYSSGKKLVYLARERNSENCGAHCGSLYGACYGGCVLVCEIISIVECLISLGASCNSVEDCIKNTCKEICGEFSKECIPIGPDTLKECKKLFKNYYVKCRTDDCRDACSDKCPGPECDDCLEECRKTCKEKYAQELQNCLTSTVGCHGNPFTPKTREVFPENIPKKEYEKVLESAETFQEAFEKIRLLGRELEQLGYTFYRLEDAFALWYREKETTSLFDCNTLKYMELPEGPTECPFGGNTYFHCK